MSIPTRHSVAARKKCVTRSFDVCVSSALLFVTLPVTALIAILLYLERPGPVFQRHRRIGRRGQAFTLLTFRRSSVHDDPSRISEGSERDTNLERLIHELYLDELPQLINILKGEMSFLGPPPTIPTATVASHTLRRR